jgi:hypothetical protein
MYEVKLNIEEQYLVTLLQYLETLKSAQIERVIKKRLIKSRINKNEELLETLAIDDPLRLYIKPLRENVTAEELAHEQNYKGTDWEKIDELAKTLDIQEPLDVLLEQLKS